MLADTGRKDEIIETPEIRIKCADVMDDAAYVNVNGKARPLISLIRCSDHIPEVIADPRDTEKSALLPETVADLFFGKSLAAEEIPDAAVDVTDAVIVDQTGSAPWSAKDWRRSV